MYKSTILHTCTVVHFTCTLNYCPTKGYRKWSTMAPRLSNALVLFKELKQVCKRLWEVFIVLLVIMENYTYVYVGNRKRGRCGDCQGCTEQEDCGICINCKDKPKFRGPGRKKQCVSSVNVSMNHHMPFKTFYFTDSYSIRHTTC